MTRFIMVNDRLVSVDHIVIVAECDNGDTKITLDNGEVLTAPSSLELDQAIMGCHYVVAVIPCHGVDALMLGPDREEYSATMEAMVLTADGVIRPLEYHRDEGSWEQECSFIGFTPRRDG